MSVPYTFGSILGGASIPLSELDDNFSYLTTSPTFTGNITVNGGVDSFGTSSYFGGSASLVYTGIGIRNTAPNGYSSINWLIGPAGVNGIAGIYYAPGIFLRMTVDANDTTTPITFNNNNNQERMRIDASGNVGIGTSSPASRVNIKGNNEALRIDADFGLIRGYGADSTTSVGFIQFNKSSDMIISAEQSIPIVFRTNAIERARLTSSGQFVINTSGAETGEYLRVNTTSGRTGITLEANGVGPFMRWLDNGSSEWSIGIPDGSGSITFVQGRNALADGTERARIDSSGNLLVGTTGGLTGKGFVVNNPTNGSYTDICHSSAAGGGYAYEQFRYNGSVIGSISQDSTTGVLYNTTSDVSLKENIFPANSSIASILAFPVDQFDWKNGGHTEYGCVAQKAIEYAPEIVTQGDIWSVDYGRITPRLIKAFQELAAKVAELEEKLNAK